ncbi:MAG: sigma-54-dependent Fis family transcriptional regulator [Desulfosarcina sp.]|nr:sigma-54-dependent Fis family transcriptional regulator [Desulfosarcina sp.]MBC2764741.1 sigma-54-dependent Fis family transcriptional regulator [Desulfosarcina sp.]
MQYSIFVVDDEQSIRTGIESAMGGDYQVKTFKSAEEVLEGMEADSPDLVLLDIGLPGMDGIAALKVMKARIPDLLVIMITAYEDVNTVISAMKLGAYDYIIKPIQLEALEVTVGNALETINLRKEIQALQENLLQENMPCFIGESDAIQEVMEFITRVARSPDTPVLILGETGTGKELIASAIHYRSPNFRGPLVSLNCSAIPNDLIESELFGYEKGAFSGASATGKQGLIESSADGTLFLDEVGDLSFEAQAKLLRFLESGEFYKVGGTTKQRIQTRMLSATNKDIHQMITDERFRKDLFYRLGVVKVRIPSLKERKKDILPLARYFLDLYRRKFESDVTKFSSDAEVWLLQYAWPGNVRELKNRLERALLISNGKEISAEDLKVDAGVNEPLLLDADHAEIPDDGVDFNEILESTKRAYIAKALRMTRGNEAQAARLLNINHHTFRYHCKKLNLK